MVGSDTNAKNASIDFNTRSESNKSVSNSGMSTPEENKPSRSLQKNMDTATSGYASNLMSMRQRTHQVI